MSITYNTRIAAQQGGVIPLRIGALLALPAVVAQTSAGGTFNNRNIINGTDYFNFPPPLPGGAAMIAPPTITNDSVVRNYAAQPIVGYNCALGDDVISSVITSGSNPPNTLPFTKVTVPLYPGPITETFFDVGFFVPAGWNDQTQYPPTQILNSIGQLRLTVSANAIRNDIDPPTAGQFALLNTFFMSTTIEKKWEGYDTVIGNGGYGGSITTRPRADLAGNFLMFSGVYLGNGTRPLLIDAGLDGGEFGRYYLKLDNPIWDAVLAQPVATHSLFEIFPCNAGWYGCFDIRTVSPPTMIVFNPDCTQYWIYELVGIDRTAINTLINSQWGQSGSERIFLDTPLAATNNPANGLFIIGAGDNATAQATLLGNVSSSRVLLPPFAPYVPLTCVPCAPMQLAGGSWVGKVGGG